MEPFVQVARVRETFLLEDAVKTPDAWIARAIRDAHTELERALSPMALSALDGGTIPEDLVAGEALLAGARLYQAMAAVEAYGQRRVKGGSVAVAEGDRFASLLRIASMAEERAWTLLRPYMREAAVRPSLAASDSAPILGGGRL